MSSIQLPDNFFCQLDEVGIISLSGEQADSYLQGQITANVDAITASVAGLACHCDFKGKMWNAGWLVRHADSLDFTVQASALPECLAQLNKYGVFSKVDIADSSEQKHLFGLVGQQALEALSALVEELPTQHLGVAHFANGWILALEGHEAMRYLLCTQDPAALKELLASVPEVSAQYWYALDIERGIAPIYGQTSNEFVPQMFNMQALDAIDFKKGCYMGQEVVARTKYLGKNKRATYRLIATTESDSLTVEPSATLEKAIEDNWRRGGTVVHAANVENKLSLLAVLSNDTQVGDVLRLKEFPDALFTVAELPYELTE